MFDILVGMIIGVIISLTLMYVWLKLAIHRAKQEIEELVATINSVTGHIVRARVERHHDVFYVYNAQDHTFMAQGADMAELREKIESRWRDAQVFVTEGDPEILAALKATVSKSDATHA